MNTTSYIHILERQLKWFKGTVLKYPNFDCGIQTTKCTFTYKETINFLKTKANPQR